MAESLRDRVRAAIAMTAERDEVSEHKLPDTLTLEELGLDSLDRISMAMAVEDVIERYNTFSDDEILGWATIADVVRSAEVAHG